MIVFTPLWFIGAYLLVVVLTPVTASVHRRARWLALGALAAAVVAADVGRFARRNHRPRLGQHRARLGPHPPDRLPLPGRVGAPAAAWPVRWRWRRPRSPCWPALTSLPGLPGVDGGHGRAGAQQHPTDHALVIAVVAVLQFGVAMRWRAPLSRWLQRRRVWACVVAVNSVIMTMFLWHMTALLVVLELLRAAGIAPLSRPTARPGGCNGRSGCSPPRSCWWYWSPSSGGWRRLAVSTHALRSRRPGRSRWYGTGWRSPPAAPPAGAPATRPAPVRTGARRAAGQVTAPMKTR